MEAKRDREMRREADRSRDDAVSRSREATHRLHEQGLLLTTEDPHTAYVDYTGVTRDWRGRGIARALKQVAAQRLEGFGIRRLRTEVEASNAAMLAVNAQFGYTMGRGRYRVVKPIVRGQAESVRP
ncbi:N-acetyltransferase family protein [Streptosporangium sp. CA-135522]|uniref:GNAT family N-acetyltransferase n=1 Tax=Streptosporangium sp. CA-135522 TaxID=3240072 RepID=UPI003D8DFD62